jgi:hypothetical protein
MQTNKQTYIDFIIDCFNKGVVERIDVMAMFGKKWQMPTRTFDRYFKQAKEAYNSNREAINEAKLNTTIETEKEALKTLILDKTKRMQIAEEIAMGKAKRVEGQIVMPSFADRMKALDYLSKIEGDYTAIKQEVNITTPTINYTVIEPNND